MVKTDKALIRNGNIDEELSQELKNYCNKAKEILREREKGTTNHQLRLYLKKRAILFYQFK